MAIDAYGNNATTSTVAAASNGISTEDKTILGKDDFMKLLLVELQHQDPTEPMDSEKILSQTSQLATLEASDNTNTALEKLAASLQSSMGFSSIAAIGKIADTGDDTVTYETGKSADFELYFPAEVTGGEIQITDAAGNIIRTIAIGANPSGVYAHSWDGTLDDGTLAEPGVYHAQAAYIDADGTQRMTRAGAYPIESVRFENGQTEVRVGSKYVPFESIVEVMG